VRLDGSPIVKRLPGLQANNGAGVQMLSFVQNWFTPQGNAIGVDFGTDCLRLAQVERQSAEHRLIAAGGLDVPPHLRNDIPARLEFYTKALRDLLAQGSFTGRKAIITLPASMMYIQHLRLPKMDEDALKKALPWELRGKLPIDPSQALLRHIVAGEVYLDQEPKIEVIVMAARRDLVDQLLAATAKAKLDVVGMNTEAKAIIDCFANVYRRQCDVEATTCYLDMGCNASRAVIARGTDVLFARVIPVGGEHFSRAVAATLKMTLDDAKMLRVRLAAEENTERRAKDEFTASNPASAPQAPVHPTGAKPERDKVEEAYREPLAKLTEELGLCKRYYEATFPNRPLDRLIFLGGEARHRGLCQKIAHEMGIAAQIGDPLARIPRDQDGGAESGIDRTVPQPAWGVAVGLTMGPTEGPASKAPEATVKTEPAAVNS
jgi:type IV pilus assembly protein PilM